MNSATPASSPWPRLLARPSGWAPRSTGSSGTDGLCANRRLLDHLGRERGALFTFLAQPGVQATNWRAEQAIRPAVVCRTAWGGNATWDGAETWQVLASVLRTTTQQQRDPVALLAGLLLAPARWWPTW